MEIYNYSVDIMAAWEKPITYLCLLVNRVHQDQDPAAVAKGIVP